MDSLINAAARALAAGDPLAALKNVALRDDPPALALRGIAMAQLGDFARARSLLRQAAHAFGANEPVAGARCTVAEAEIALVSRDLGRPLRGLAAARTILDAHRDRANAAHAACLEARYMLLIGKLDAAEHILENMDEDGLPPATQAGLALVAAGIAMRRVQTRQAQAAMDRAALAAEAAAIPALVTEVDHAARALAAPAARLITRNGSDLLTLEGVEALLASPALIVDACRNIVRAGRVTIPLASRPVLFALVRALAEGWPGDVSREDLLIRAFRARHADESHRVRLRVEVARLRKLLAPLADVSATRRGFALKPRGANIVVIAPPSDDDHGDLLALLADGEAWSSSALALALGVSARTAQRALETLGRAGKVESFGHGRAFRWIASKVPGFPTSLLLPAPLPIL